MYHSHYPRSNKVDVAGPAAVVGAGIDGDGDWDRNRDGSIRGVHIPSAACMAIPLGAPP